MGRSGWTLAALAVVVGCGTTYEYRTTRLLDGGALWLPPARATFAAPELALSDAEIQAHLGAPAAEACCVPQAPACLQEATAALRACYDVRARDAADQLLAEREDLITWDRPDGRVEVEASFRGAAGLGGALLLSVHRRPGFTGSLSVAFPPGTYAAPAPPPGSELAGLDDWNSPDAERRFGAWPPPQDLALLRAPVLHLPADAASVSVTVPVACASFHRGAPRDGAPYALARFPRGSRIDLLLQAVCAGAEPPPEAEVQLAVWMSRDDVSWDEFRAEGGHWGRLVTFGRALPVLPSDASGAARLVLEAGVDPRPLRFFQRAGAPRGPEEAPPPAALPLPSPEERAPAPAVAPTA